MLCNQHASPLKHRFHASCRLKQARGTERLEKLLVSGWVCFLQEETKQQQKTTGGFLSLEIFQVGFNPIK